MDAKRILREIRLLKFFDHENIIKIIDLQRPEAKTGYKDIYIITNLMETDMHRVIYSKQVKGVSRNCRMTIFSILSTRC